MSFLVVLGMHRSGTSSLTGVLNLLGFSAGNKFIGANEFNERGYFEDVVLNENLDSFLLAIDRSWKDERAYASDWLSSQAAITATEEIKESLKTEFDFSQPTVIKNPRISRLLPLMQPIWKNAGLSTKYVLCLRSPLAVIQSLARRDSIVPQRAALLYVAHLLEAELHTRNQPRVFVEYDGLLQDWPEVIKQIDLDLDLDLFTSCQSDSSCFSKIDAFLTKELNHFSEEQPQSSSYAIDLATEVYELLRGPMSDSRLSELDSVRLRWLNYLSSLEPWLSETAALDRLINSLPTALLTPSKEIVLKSSLNAKSELFFACNGEGFTESSKASVSWAYDQKISQRFVIPALAQPLRALRWDITDRPAFCEIEKVWIEDPLGHVHWESKQGTNFLTQISVDTHILGYSDSGFMQIMASGFDPHATLIIPDTLLAIIQPGWALCAVWQAIFPTVHLPHLMQHVSLTKEKLAKADEFLNIATSERDALKSSNNDLAKKLQELNFRYQQTREEILMAEGQLEIIKDLILRGKEMNSL
jgi:hypothetical protein